MSDKTSVMSHGTGEDKQEGPHLDQLLPHDGEMMDHKSSDPARGELDVHEFSSEALKNRFEHVLGEKNRK
jgi:hypothetical protein